MKKSRGLLKKKHRLHKARQDGASSAPKETVYNMCTKVHARFLAERETKSFADRMIMKTFYDAL